MARRQGTAITIADDVSARRERPAIAVGPRGAVVAWSDWTTGGYGLFTSLLADGVDIATDGERFLVVWAAKAPKPYTVFGQRLGSAGQLLDATPRRLFDAPQIVPDSPDLDGVPHLRRDAGRVARRDEAPRRRRGGRPLLRHVGVLERPVRRGRVLRAGRRLRRRDERRRRGRGAAPGVPRRLRLWGGGRHDGGAGGARARGARRGRRRLLVR